MSDAVAPSGGVPLPLSGAAIRSMAPLTSRERALGLPFFVARSSARVFGPVAAPVRRARLSARARQTLRIARKLEAVPTEALVTELADRRGTVVAGRAHDRRTAEVLARLVVLMHRTSGLWPFRSQVMGALAIFSGKLAEMETGSGKTLTAALAAALAVHGGEAVHVVTANDYLARRDRETFRPFLEAMGISTGLVVAGVQPQARAPEYARDVVYASNKEIAFDYLRNRIHLGAEAGAIRLALEPVFSEQPKTAALTMRGLPFAIVDEADSVLIDECRTPLIISANARPDPDWAETALALGDGLLAGRDYDVDTSERKVTLTEAGRARLAERGEELGGAWRNQVRRDHAAVQAISARALYHLDEHYIVRDGKVELIDEYTGRIAEGRALGDGLQQAIEAKEGVEVSGRRYTQGRMTYQRFFRRYRRLGGMTGTAREVAPELYAVYGLPVLRIPPPKRSRRRILRTRIFRDETVKWARVVDRIAEITGQGRPVLVGTRTIKASHDLAEALDAAGQDYALLNAVQDADEAEVIGRAGRAAQVTVATNMAGRGVDIVLDDAVREKGGLHVILTEMHEAGRIDRQVMGRTARQGDPGTCEEFLSWKDPLPEKFGGWRARARYGGRNVFRRAQKRAERIHSRARVDLLRYDLRKEDQLSFSGMTE